VKLLFKASVKKAWNRPSTQLIEATSCVERSNARINSLTPKSFPAGMKNSRSEDFFLAKHKDTNIPTMLEPFSSPAAWFDGRAYPTPGSLRRRGWTRPSPKGFIRINKLKEKIIYFYSLSVNYNNHSPAIGNDSQNGINCHRRAAITYELTHYILPNNAIARLYFIMTRIKVFSYGYARQIIINRKKCSWFACHFDDHVNQAVRCQVHRQVRQV